MTQPTFKKYRRRVSDERVERAAEAMRYNRVANREAANENNLLPLPIALPLARDALEADAEVVEAKPTDPYGVGKITHMYHPSIYPMTTELKQFHAEWEVIENA